MTIGERLKQLRIQKGLTQQEVADAIGYKSKSNINKIESGNRDIPRSMISKFAKFYNVSPLFLLGLEKEKTIVKHDQDMIPIRPNLMDKFRRNRPINNKKPIIVTNKELQITFALMKELPDEEIQNINALIEAYVNTHKKERK